MVIVGAGRARSRDIADVDHADAGVPDGGPELVAVTLRMMEAVAIALPGRNFTSRDMLSRHPPARYFFGPCWMLQVVDHQDIADISLHLGGDIGVAFVHIEAMHPEPVRLHIRQQARLRRSRDVPDLEPALRVGSRQELACESDLGRLDVQSRRDLGIFGRPAEFARQSRLRRDEGLCGACRMALVLLDVGDHEVADDPDFVRVRASVVERQFGDHARLRRVADVDHGGAVRRRHVADESMVTGDVDLPATGDVEMPDPLHVVRQGARLRTRRPLARGSVGLCTAGRRRFRHR